MPYNKLYVPEPYYVTEQGYVTIVFKKGTSATGYCATDYSTQLTDRQQDILHLIIENCGTSAKQIAEALHISVRTTSTEISVLRKNGFIEKENKDNKSPWVILKK